MEKPEFCCGVDARQQEEIKALKLELGLLKIHSEHQATLLASCENALEERDNLLMDKAYLKNRGDGVDGHFCIARKHKNGYHEFWNDQLKVWCSAGSVFELGKQ